MIQPASRSKPGFCRSRSAPFGWSTPSLDLDGTASGLFSVASNHVRRVLDKLCSTKVRGEDRCRV
jgi:hypothetical protein